MRATGDKVVIKEDKTDLETASGLRLAAVKRDVRVGRVLSAGPKATEEEGVKDGDLICFVGEGTLDAFIEGQRLTVIRASGVVCVIDEAGRNGKEKGKSKVKVVK